MQEYVTDAFVLNTEPNGDLDSRISLFTKRFGKLVAKAKSIRKITSKLSGHLQIGNRVQVRLVERNGLQVVDALKTDRLDVPPPRLARLHELLAEAEPEHNIWQMLAEGRFSWLLLLKELGWDPKQSRCHTCGKRAPFAFHVGQQEFFCERCASRFSPHEVIYIGDI